MNNAQASYKGRPYSSIDVNVTRPSPTSNIEILTIGTIDNTRVTAYGIDGRLISEPVDRHISQTCENCMNLINTSGICRHPVIKEEIAIPLGNDKIFSVELFSCPSHKSYRSTPQP